MIHLFSKLAQIFSLLALCVVGILVALVFVQADIKKLEQEEQISNWACGTVSPSEHLVLDTAIVSDTIIAGKALFENNCQQCHSAGADVVVGPGLKGILERRTMEWVVPWVQNSQRMIAGGDPYGNALYNKYNKAQMQSFDLTEYEIKAIMAYIQIYKEYVYLSDK
ncbi:hypothetical protein BKI52_27380 [marine bacterium AO1-C]|nr:hypothetical protein BKI52_27380 [marine bacterium AO1-C]